MHIAFTCEFFEKFQFLFFRFEQMWTKTMHAPLYIIKTSNYDWYRILYLVHCGSITVNCLFGNITHSQDLESQDACNIIMLVQLLYSIKICFRT